MNNVAANISWIFIPLSLDAVFEIRAWVHRLAVNKSDDETLAKNCAKIIEDAFLAHALSYDCEKYGKVRMNELRLLLGSDGICVPEHCFVAPPETLRRVQEPLRPFVRDV